MTIQQAGEVNWRGKTWGELDEHDWRIVRGADRTLYDQLIQASEAREQNIAPPVESRPEPATVYSADEVKAAVAEATNLSVVQRKSEYSQLVKGIGSVLKIRINQLKQVDKEHEAQVAALKATVIALEDRIVTLETKPTNSMLFAEQAKRMGAMAGQIDKLLQGNSALNKELAALRRAAQSG